MEPRIEQLTTRYLEAFGELPVMPLMVGYSVIADLMEDAIISKIPVSQDQINARVAEITEPIDLAEQFLKNRQNP